MKSSVKDTERDFLELSHFFLQHPPDGKNESLRRQAIYQFDDILQNPELTGRRGPYDIGSWHRTGSNLLRGFFLDMLYRSLLPQLHKTPEVCTLHHIYNCGYIVKTPQVSIGIDVILPIQQGWWQMDASLAETLAESMDMLFITHALDNSFPEHPLVHKDHYDFRIIKKMLRQEKPVFMHQRIQEMSGFWQLQINPVEAAFIHWIKPNEPLKIQGVEVFPANGRHVYRQLGQELPHLTYEIKTPEGCHFLHTGDLDYTAADSPLELHLANSTGQLDMLFMKCGGVSPMYDEKLPGSLGNDLDAFSLGLKKLTKLPQRILPSHLAELSHPVLGGRESYRTALALAERYPAQIRVLLWGESLSL